MLHDRDIFLSDFIDKILAINKRVLNFCSIAKY